MFSKQWHYSGADSSIGILVCGYPLNVPFQSIATPFGLSLQSTNVPHHLHKHHHSNVCKKHSLKLDNLSQRVKSTLILVWKSLPGVNFTPQCAIRFGVGCAYGCAPKTWSQVFTLVSPDLELGVAHWCDHKCANTLGVEWAYLRVTRPGVKSATWCAH